MKKIIIGATGLVLALTLLVTFSARAEGISTLDKLNMLADKVLNIFDRTDETLDKIENMGVDNINLSAQPGPYTFSDHTCQNGICKYVVERECPIATSSPLFVLQNPVNATATLEYFAFEKYAAATSTMAFYIGTTTSYTTASSSTTYTGLTGIVNAYEVATTVKAYISVGHNGGASNAIGQIINPTDYIMGVATGTVAGNLGEYGNVRDFQVDCRYKMILRYHK